MATKNVVIIGANRGIGLSLIKAFASRSWELKETGAKILEIDYLNEDTIQKAAETYGDKPLDILINVGGLPPHPKPWHEQSAEFIIERFRVMALGPFLAMKHFLPKLEKASQPKIVNISSAFGSISGNSFGTCMAYRVAKAALNQEAVTLAREWEKEGRKTTIVCVEPGFLSTRLTGWDGEDDMETCIAGLMKVIEGITPEQNGSFVKWDGTRIPF